MNTSETLTFLSRGIAIVVALLLIAALKLGQDVLIPGVLAGLSSFLLSPFVNGRERWRLPRWATQPSAASAPLAYAAAT